MRVPDFSFLTEPAYYDELALRISQTRAGDRVVLATMTFEPGRVEVWRIFDELSRAAQRGVHVLLLVDAYPFLIERGYLPGPLLLSRKLPEHLPAVFRARYDMLQALAAGGHYAILNQPGRRFSNPFAGRSHIKLALVNNYVYLGGSNLDADNHLDNMVRFYSPVVVDRLMVFAKQLEKFGSVREALGDKDNRLVVDKNTTILVDSGVPWQSIILKSALKCIDDARKWLVFTCQYFPNDATMAHLVAAHRRGVHVRLIYNHPSKHAAPHNLLHYGVRSAQRLRVPPEFFREDTRLNKKFLHAKLIASEHGAIMGSHNYVTAGVKFGTAEIALVSSDPQFARDAVEAIEKQL